MPTHASDFLRLGEAFTVAKASTRKSRQRRHLADRDRWKAALVAASE